MNATMTRKDKGFRLDTRIVEALAKVKTLTGKSANAYVEELLMMNLKSLGIIPVETEALPETRGGTRSKMAEAAPKVVAPPDNLTQAKPPEPTQSPPQP